MESTVSVFEEVKAVVVRVIGVETRAGSLTPDSRLAGLPEFDSMAVLDVLLAIEERFGISVDDDEVSGELFETLGALAAFVESKIG